MPRSAALLEDSTSNSLIPDIFHHWFHMYGIQSSYEAIPVDSQDLPEALLNLESERYIGVNLASSLQKQAAGLADTCSEAVEQTGMADTLTFTGKNQLHADHFTGIGLIDATNHQTLWEYRHSQIKVVLVGSGEPARSILAAMKARNVHDITLLDSNPERALQMAESLKIQIECLPLDQAESALLEADLLVNATSESHRLPLEIMESNATVADLILGFQPTALLKRAGENEFHTVSGLLVLMSQCRQSFSEWYGLTPFSYPRMEKTFLNRMKVPA